MELPNSDTNDPDRLTEGRRSAALPILLGLGTILLTFFIESQLLRVTDGTPPRGDVTQRREAAYTSVMPQTVSDSTGYTSLQVRSRVIDPGTHPSTVSERR